MSEPELAKFIELGHLQPTDLLWRDGFPDWRPAMVVFPQRSRAGPAAAARALRPRAGATQPSAAPPRAAAERGPAHQAQPQGSDHGPAADAIASGTPRTDEPEPRGGGLRRAVADPRLLAVLGAAGWFAYPHRATLMEIVKTLPSRVMALVPAMPTARARTRRRSRASAARRRRSTRGCRRRALWRVIKREFPDWYAERLKEAAALAAQDKDEAAIGQHLARAWLSCAASRSTTRSPPAIPQLKAVATTFYENLAQLRKHSIEACFAFISQGEAEPGHRRRCCRAPQHAAHLQAQLTAVFEAIADGRKTPRVYPQPRKTDYDTLAADLAKRGWTPGRHAAVLR